MSAEPTAPHHEVTRYLLARSLLDEWMQPQAFALAVLAAVAPQALIDEAQAYLDEHMDTEHLTLRLDGDAIVVEIVLPGRIEAVEINVTIEVT